jgi:prepilin-type N-terminal cleavage/methylation domain-containing protein
LRLRDFLIARKQGLTLIEIMVVVAIVSVISAGILMVAIRSLHAYYTVTALNELSNNASFAMDEIIRDLRESKLDTINIAQPQDPATGHWHDIIAFASARGLYYDSFDPPIDERSFQYDSDTGKPLWISAIVYYPFTTQNGVMQLRKYVYYHPYKLNEGRREVLSDKDFSLYATVTAGNINLFIVIKEEDVNSLLYVFDRANDAERVLANHISTEDANANRILDPNEDDGAASLPMDNEDGVLDTGADYSITGNSISIKLFLQKPITYIAGTTQRRVALTLNGAATLRN